MVGSGLAVIGEVLWAGVRVQAVGRPVHRAEYNIGPRNTRTNARHGRRCQSVGGGPNIIKADGQCGRAPSPVFRSIQHGRFEFHQPAVGEQHRDHVVGRALQILLILVQVPGEDVRCRVGGCPRGHVVGKKLSFVLLRLATGAIAAALEVNVKDLQAVRAGQLQLKREHPPKATRNIGVRARRENRIPADRGVALDIG